ncbi:hypothetical protein J5751_05910 [bacterium]|nr:hypothetical protein [bacterium]
MENIPIDTTFDATNEELESGVQEKKLAPEPYVFSNTEPWNKYDVRKLKFSPLLDYKGLENKNNGKKVKPSFDFF